MNDKTVTSNDFCTQIITEEFLTYTVQELFIIVTKTLKLFY